MTSDESPSAPARCPGWSPIRPARRAGGPLRRSLRSLEWVGYDERAHRPQRRQQGLAHRDGPAVDPPATDNPVCSSTVWPGRIPRKGQR